MTDLYVGNRKGPPLLLLSGVLILLLGLILGVWLFLRPNSTENEITDSEPGSTEEQPSSTPAPGPTPDVSGLAKQVASGDRAGAREHALSLLADQTDPVQRTALESFLGELHFDMLRSGKDLEELQLYRVKSGDTLGALARRFGTTEECIAWLNGIENNLIRVGETLRILSGDFALDVSKEQNNMRVDLNGRFFKRYTVGTGTDGSTPEGDYKITLRLRHPTWYMPDRDPIPYGHPDNLLGTHYLKLDLPGIGVHGTWEPESVGSQSSAGCVRLRNPEIEELFILLPVGTPVRIHDA